LEREEMRWMMMVRRRPAKPQRETILIYKKKREKEERREEREEERISHALSPLESLPSLTLALSSYRRSKVWLMRLKKPVLCVLSLELDESLREAPPAGRVEAQLPAPPRPTW